MNVILVSGRYEDAGGPLARDEALVRSFPSGCRVRWIVPVPEVREGSVSGEPSKILVASPAPGFARVTGRLVDSHTERAVAQEIRRDLPDLVHMLDFGGTTSCNIGWTADRLGVRCVVSASPVATVCHRADLRRAPDGEECGVFDDPERCSACVCASPELGMRRRLLAKVLRRGAWPFRGYPARLDFESRLEIVLAGLQVARAVLVRDPAGARLLEGLGLRKEALRVLAEPDAEGLLPIYRDALAT